MIESPLLPSSWDEYRGQTALKSRLSVHIASARTQGHQLPDVLLSAPAGYGKTTMATLVAKQLERRCVVIGMPFTNEDLRDLGNAAGTVLVLDEIHRLNQAKQEELLTLFDARYIKPKGKPIVRLWDTTIIGCTTEVDQLIDPLRDRFMIQPQFEQYTDIELGEVVSDMATRMEMSLNPDDCIDLAQAAGGVPRKACHLILAARDMMFAYGRVPRAGEVLEFCSLERDGMGSDHRRYMTALYTMADSVGMTALRHLLDMNENQVRDVERLVIRLGYVGLTSRGRELTEKGGERCKEMGVER